MDALNAFEADILLALHGLWRSPAGDAVTKALDFLGEGGLICIALAVVLLIIPRTRPYGALVAAALILDVLTVNMLLKPLIARPRPYDFTALPIFVPPQGDHAFPSGHTAVTFAAAVALWPAGRRVFWPALAFACIMGVSRLYLMMHYPTDVLAGAVMGALCGLAAIWLWKRAQDHSKLKFFRTGKD